MQMNVGIKNIEFYLPENIENKEVWQKDNPDWIVPKILSKTGIVQCYVSSKDDTALDLAYEASIKIVSALNDKEEIDLLILVTQSPDYVLPTSACILQGKLGLKKSCMAFDINLGCSGYVYALSIVASLLESGIANKALLVCSDTYTKYISKHDRTCRPLFSDGAAATLLEKTETKALGPFIFGTDGKGFDKLIVHNSGARKDKDVKNQEAQLYMQGSDVFMFTMREVPLCVKELLTKANLKKDEIDLFIFHQASKLVIDNLTRLLELNKDKVFTNYEHKGNTVSATIPIALKDAENVNRLKKGDKVMLIGFGVGLSWGATIITWEGLK